MPPRPMCVEEGRGAGDVRLPRAEEAPNGLTAPQSIPRGGGRGRQPPIPTAAGSEGCAHSDRCPAMPRSRGRKTLEREPGYNHAADAYQVETSAALDSMGAPWTRYQDPE